MRRSARLTLSVYCVSVLASAGLASAQSSEDRSKLHFLGIRIGAKESDFTKHKSIVDIDSACTKQAAEARRPTECMATISLPPLFADSSPRLIGRAKFIVEPDGVYLREFMQAHSECSGAERDFVSIYTGVFGKAADLQVKTEDVGPAKRIKKFAVWIEHHPRYREVRFELRTNAIDGGPSGRYCIRALGHIYAGEKTLSPDQ